MATKTPPEQLWTALLASNAIAGEQQQEHIQYNAHTQVFVQVLQAIALIPSLGGLLYGIWLLGTALAWIAAMLITIPDSLFAATLLGGAGLIARGLADFLFDRLEWNPRPWRALATLLLTICPTLLLLDVVRILAGPWTYRETLRLLGGLALTAAGALLTWRFTNELWNPLFPKSPAIHVLERLIERLAPEPEKVPELQPYPVRVNSNLHAVDVVEDLENLDEEDPPDFSPQFLDLIRFVELAARFGLSRDDSGNAKGLVTHPRHHLPSGRRLTRPVYNELLTLATDRWQFIQQHGPGIAPTWRVPPEEALELLRAVLHSRQAGRQTRQAGNQG